MSSALPTADQDPRAPLFALLPDSKDTDAGDLLERFLTYVERKGLVLYPAQENAILELFEWKNVILSTPTGSGKSLVALAMHFFAMARGMRSFYTCPIKALVSEKFFALCKEFGPDNVGMLTGDAAVNRDAPIVCCTAEILANMALREGRHADCDFAILDEFHYYADKERGAAWQIPLLELSHTTFLLMSATLGDPTRFDKTLTALNGQPTAIVTSTHRPVPLDFSYSEIPLHEAIPKLVASGQAPVYLVAFTQRGAAEEAQNLMSVDFATKEEKKAILAEIGGMRFDSPYGKDVSRYVKHGIGIHHAGLLPKYRLLVEKLAQKGLLKVISGTDTLGVGVNVPIRTVLFTKLCKFDGEKTAILSARDFHQIAGRAGRKGFDERGSVVAQAPEHVIENLRLEAKAGSDPVKRKRIVRKKPPDRGYVHWDKATFERLIASLPEPLPSRFKVTHGLVLNVLGREGGGCLALGRILKKSHETPHNKKVHSKTAQAMVRSLVDAKILAKREGRLIIAEELPRDFSLHQTLSLYLLDTLSLVDPEMPTYGLEVLTLVESILENPDMILMKQLDRLKRETMSELKAKGVEYEERIAELDKLEYPKPNRDFLYGTWNAFAAKHPWAEAENVRPKSIAREMFENFLGFSDYIKDYELERSEGLLLRYLSEVYKVLVQTVPPKAKDEVVVEIIDYFRAIVRQVDSSLLDEWESLRSGKVKEPEAALVREPPPPEDITRDVRGFGILVRAELVLLLRYLSRGAFEEAAKLGDAQAIGAQLGIPVPRDLDPQLPASAFKAAMDAFYVERTALRVDPAARASSLTHLEPGEVAWRFRHRLIDPEGHDDVFVEGTVDLDLARLLGRPVLHVERFAGLE